MFQAFRYKLQFPLSLILTQLQGWQNKLPNTKQLLWGRRVQFRFIYLSHPLLPDSEGEVPGVAAPAAAGQRGEHKEGEGEEEQGRQQVAVAEEEPAADFTKIALMHFSIFLAKSTAFLHFYIFTLQCIE